MNLIGTEVNHKVYGSGEIVEIAEGRVSVHFSSVTKAFLYPDSFEKYLVLKDHQIQHYVNEKLQEQNKQKKLQKEQQAQKTQANTYSRKMIKTTNSQAVFALKENDYENLSAHWSVFTGKSMAGKLKGLPRIPKNINVNSCCLLTMKSEKEKEKDRYIVGIFMVPEDFIGENCKSGVIPAHEKYRILWNEDHEKLLLWDYFPEQSRLEKWGNSEMKYLQSASIKKILEDMLRFTEGEEEQNQILGFYHYFCDINHI